MAILKILTILKRLPSAIRIFYLHYKVMRKAGASRKVAYKPSLGFAKLPFAWGS